MRKARRLVGLVLALALLAAACGDDDDTSGNDASGEGTEGTEAEGGTLTWGLHVGIEQLDVQQSLSLATGMAVGRNVFDRLVDHDEALNIVPGLATDWEVSDDGLVWTFHLREGVTFHDGTPFNADAVVFTVERALDPELSLPAGSFAWGGVTEVRKVDDLTVELVSEEPVAALLNNIADSGLGAIISPTSVADDGEFTPIGTGPFQLESWVPDGDLVLVRNDDYWGEAPTLDEVVVTTSTEPSTRVNQLEATEVDLITQVPLQDVERLESSAEIELGIGESTSWTYISLNNLRPPFDDIAVRQAVNYAVDKQAIVDNILFGVGQVADSPIGSAYLDHQSVMTYDQDVDQAEDLLDQAGWEEGSDGIRAKDGQRLEATLLVAEGRFAGGLETAQAVAADLSDVGMEVTIDPVDFATYSEIVRGAADEVEFEMALAGWGTADPDTGLGFTLSTSAQPPEGNNLAFYSNDRVDQLLAEGAVSLDPDDRRAIYGEVQEIAMEDAPWLFLNERREAVAWQSDVQGVELIPSSAGLIDVRHASVGG